MWIDSNVETLHQKPNQTTFLDPKYAKTHLQQSPILKIARGRAPGPPLKGEGKGLGGEEGRGGLGGKGWEQERGGLGARKGRDRDRGGEKGVPPHSTTHFNHCI